jgi:uncharacterized membrane protein
MYQLIQFFHLAAAIFWMGGMAFIVLALRRPLTEQLEPPVRLQLLGAVLSRFFIVVGISIAVLLSTGVFMFVSIGPAEARPGIHAMAGIGLLMMLIFGHLYFSPYRRLRQAVAAGNWPEAGKRAGQITLIGKINLGLGWIAIGAVMLWR